MGVKRNQIRRNIRNQPSIDVGGAGGNTHYVFGRGDGNVYIYNSNGVQSVIPMKYFVTPKR